MPTTEYITLDASGSNSTTLNDAPTKILSAAVTTSPSLVQSPIRILTVSASSAVSAVRGAMKICSVAATSIPTFSRVITKTLLVAAVSVPSVVKLIGHTFSTVGSAIAYFVEQHWGPRPFAIVRGQNNWVYSEIGGWYTITANNWTETVLGD